MRDDIVKYNRLKEYEMIVSWKFLSLNPEPAALKLIKEKLKQEGEMSIEHYKWLGIFDKIDWSYLSSNPIAIKILSMPENRDKVKYYDMSKNPKAIELIKKRIIEEGLMTEEVDRELQNNINPSNLSQNPSIFVLK